MKFTLDHNNINVLDLDRSISFYQNNLGFKVLRRSGPEDGSFVLAFLGDGVSTHQLELTWLRDWDHPYNLGDNEIHLAVKVDDYDAAHELHKANGVICYENMGMGIYFIEDPDGYWVEIIPGRR